MTNSTGVLQEKRDFETFKWDYKPARLADAEYTLSPSLIEGTHPSTFALADSLPSIYDHDSPYLLRGSVFKQAPLKAHVYDPSLGTQALTQGIQVALDYSTNENSLRLSRGTSSSSSPYSHP